jgi:hypothetical protein
MQTSQPQVTVVRGSELNFAEEARHIQDKALAHQTCVVRLDQLVFFSTESGDAWMLDAEDRYAACLARSFELQPIPIHESATRMGIEWNADYQIQGEAFTVAERNGSVRTILGYPIEEIQHLVQEFPAFPKDAQGHADEARQRLHTGRNEPCPCGSGKKYKKCCLANDEALVAHVASQMRAESLLAPEPLDNEDPSLESGPPLAPSEPDAISVPPEALDKADQLLEEFAALKNPGAAEIDALLDALLSLPPEATEWDQVFHAIARSAKADLPAVFRRLAAAIPHTKETRMSYFYWAVAEEIGRHGCRELLPEVTAGMRKLDLRSYDADALIHIEYQLLADGFDSELLGLCEHFLPIMRRDRDLMPYAVPNLCNLIFEIRAGRLLAAGPGSEPSLQQLIRQLRKGIGKEIAPEAARRAVLIATEPPPAVPWKRADFALVTGDIRKSQEAWQDALRLTGVLMRVAQEAFQLEEVPPGCAVPALMKLLESVYGSWEPLNQKRPTDNLLDYLRPAGMEERLARSCRDLIGVNVGHARLLLQAHELVLHFAVRHQLLSAASATQTETKLARLRAKLNDS